MCSYTPAWLPLLQECSIAHVIGLFRLDGEESLLRQGGQQQHLARGRVFSHHKHGFTQQASMAPCATACIGTVVVRALNEPLLFQRCTAVWATAAPWPTACSGY